MNDDNDIIVTICRSLPSWALRSIVALPWRGHIWGSAALELWDRSVTRLLAEEDDQQGWPCAPPDGVQ